MLGKRTTQTSTLVLIHEWSMDGAGADLDSHFGSPVDINAIVAGRSEEPRSEDPPPAQPALMLKPAGEDDWRPLRVEPSPA